MRYQDKTRIGGTLANVPPAAVYRLHRRPSRTLPARWPENHANPTPAVCSILDVVR